MLPIPWLSAPPKVAVAHHRHIYPHIPGHPVASLGTWQLLPGILPLSQIQYSLVASIPDHGVCMCHGCQWARGVCTVRGHWVSVTANVVCMWKYTVRTSMPFMGRYVHRSQQLRTKEGVHTYVRKSALLCTIILLETHLTDNRVTVFAARMSWLLALFLCESSLKARETRAKFSPYKRYYLRLTIPFTNAPTVHALHSQASTTLNLGTISTAPDSPTPHSLPVSIPFIKHS